MRLKLNRLSPPALCALTAAVGGLLIGATAVHGLRQNPYGPLDPPMLIRNDVTSDGHGGYAVSGTAGCRDCSERDLGYRWATLTQVSASDQCPEQSWGFRRGCLDYTGGI
jgi:hypothetical protein